MTDQQAPKHTPGPWRVADLHHRPWTDALAIGYGPDPNFAYADSGIIAYTTRGFEGSYDSNGVHDERGCAWANARLIAAAPDLLAACEAAFAALKKPSAASTVGYPPLVAQLQSAIAKAEGGQP